jgi:probable rRNA maturation factor
VKASLNRASRARPRWFDAAWSRRVATAAEALKPAWGVVNIVMVDDREIRRLNRRYRGKDKPTDVLSFSYLEDGADSADGTVGDVYFSYQTLMRDARRLGVAVPDLALRIVVHGMLHVIGYDHESDADAVRMERRERTILKRLLPADAVRGLF